MASGSNKDDELPSNYDTIVLGTGLAESILAAAFSRIGLKVLHLDRYLYYGSQWSTHMFTTMEQWIKDQQNGLQIPTTDLDKVTSLLKDGESLRSIRQNDASFRNVEEEFYIEEGIEDPIVEPVVKPAEQESTDETSNEKSEIVDEPIRNESENVELSPADETVAVETGARQLSDQSPQKRPAQWTRREIRKQFRKFNLDIRPKVLYCRGALVNLLISSDIAKYCEFKLVTRILTKRNGALEPVPCSREDVFASQAISMIEKRMLMKFLEFALNYEEKTEEFADFANKPFVEYLESRKLTAIVIHYILNAIAMTEGDVTTTEGLEATYRYLMSLGRYGNSSFLWPLYGVSELPQAFCRMCAVFGGVYCLNKTPSHLIVDSENKCVGMVCDEKRLDCTWAVMETSYAGDDILPNENERLVSRAILLTDRALAPQNEDEVTIMYLPKSETCTSSVQVLELPPTSHAAPKGIHVVHLTCESLNRSARADLEPVVDMLVAKADDQGSKPRLLWSLYFNQIDTSARTTLNPLVGNVEFLAGPDSSIHFGLPVEQAKAKFDKICPNDEFLPKAPNPDDIIVEGMEENTAGGNAATRDVPLQVEGAERADDVLDESENVFEARSADTATEITAE